MNIFAHVIDLLLVLFCCWKKSSKSDPKVYFRCDCGLSCLNTQGRILTFILVFSVLRCSFVIPRSLRVCARGAESSSLRCQVLKSCMQRWVSGAGELPSSQWQWTILLCFIVEYCSPNL